MQQRSEGAIDRAKTRHPAVCYLFDCLYLDGRSIINEPLVRRREWLVDAVKELTSYRVSEAVENGEDFLEAVKAMNLEGVMAKLKSSNYVVGKRSDCWLKIKTHKSIECIVIGFTTGKGDRESSF